MSISSETNFTFDCVFEESASNRVVVRSFLNCMNRLPALQVFEDAVGEVANRVLDGQHCTMFAYGATGSGEAHAVGKMIISQGKRTL